MQKEDQRLLALQEWLGDVLTTRGYQIKPASSDASFRRYFRVHTGESTYIAMDAPPENEAVAPFVRIARRFLSLGLNVPEIYEEDEEQGFLLLGDLGSRDYLGQLHQDSVERLYGDAMGALVVLQAGTGIEPNFLPDYSHELLMAEMKLFHDWYLNRELAIRLDHGQQNRFEEICLFLAQSALQQSRVWVHRDYHSRNLMVTQRNNPGILDFQDAVLGPVTYDLVSLLKDCYVAWPAEQVRSWVKGYHQLAQESGIPVCDEYEEFQMWFDRMGVQRHLKASGIFARLNHRDGKSGYLKDIPRTLGYIRDVCRYDKQLAKLEKLMHELAVPGWG